VSAAKKNDSPRRNRTTAILRAVIRFGCRRRAVIASGLVFATFCYGGFVLWNRLDSDVLARAEYTVDVHQIQITPPPAWIRADIKSEALRDGSLDSPLSLLDDTLAERLAKAFALHPWVARVERVAKHYPARVTVDLAYRKPAAMVEVPGGLFPVDEEGMLLPSADFSPVEARKYPRLAGIDSEPAGPIGTLWGDRAVTDGAKIAIALASVWDDLGLHSIRRRTTSSSIAGMQQTHYELRTKNGTAIPWGNAPGSEASSEAHLSEKLARLKKYLADHGALDAAARRDDLDLRVPKQTRTAERSGRDEDDPAAIH